MYIFCSKALADALNIKKNELNKVSAEALIDDLYAWHTIIEMAKIYNLKIYDYILYLFSQRPSKNISDEELDNLSPWSEGIQERIQEFIRSWESQ